VAPPRPSSNERSRVLRRLTFSFTLLLLLAGPVAAQVPADTLAADTVPRESSAPRTAFIKAMLVPGWGHFSIGSKRGFFYVALQGSSWYMLVKTLGTLQDAKDRDAVLSGVAGDSLRSVMVAGDYWRPWAPESVRRLADPFTFDAALESRTDVGDARKLVRARKQQRQDWIAYTLTFTMLSAVDAYVTAHLREFPADISASPTSGGGLSLRLDVPLPARGR